MRRFRPADEASVIALWRECDLVRPWNDPRKDIARKLRASPEGFFVAVRGRRIVGAVMAGYDGHRGWINYLAVAPAHQRGGIGRALMGIAEGYLRTAGCPKINLQVRSANAGVVAFYERLGFAVEPTVGLGKRLEQD